MWLRAPRLSEVVRLAKMMGWDCLLIDGLNVPTVMFGRRLNRRRAHSSGTHPAATGSTCRPSAPRRAAAVGLALIPMTKKLHDEVADPAGDTLGFRHLPRGFADILAAWSSETPVHPADGEPFPVDGSSISQALGLMGVVSGHHPDECDTVGLGRHRGHEGWLADVGVTARETWS